MRKLLFAVLAAGLIPVGLTAAAQPTADGQHSHGARGESHFKAMDTDHDGKVSKAEFLTRTEKMFERVDANADGFVTPEEMRSARDHMRGRSQKRQGQTGQAAPAKPAQ